ncbi:MAG TPA: polyphosphate kinase 1 [Chitinophagaceae bacterium]|nr:polyphosphate kinase 1 [Chitinophagaceae bacterium]
MLYNRDLSWLGFNFRVLQEAADKEVPLYERLKFLSIFSSNLDEFFRVRYPSVIALSKLNNKTRLKANRGATEDIAEKIQNEINRQLDIYGSLLLENIIPELKENGIVFYYNSEIKAEHIPEVKELFLSHVLSFIQPIFLDGNTTNAFIPENNHLYFVVSLKENNQGLIKQAIINIPSHKLKRFFTLTPLDGFEYVIFIDDIVRENLTSLFPGLEIIGTYSIKFNRDAELHLGEEYSGNLLAKIEKKVKKRDDGPPSRFLYQNGMPRNLLLFLASAFGVEFEDMFAGGRYHHLSDLSSFPNFNKGLNYEKLKPLSSLNVIDSGDIFNVLNTQDVLLHIPYQSYNPVLSFFNQAAVDMEVTDIYITLYRVAAESHIVNALISAAKNGKNVIAFIELKARFDEANNIKWSRVMKDAGVKIIYSIPDIKVHSKIALIKKRKGLKDASYAILSTGNFNEITAQFYTDHVLMTSDPLIIKELICLFKFLQKKDKTPGNNKLKFDKLLVSQFNMNPRLEKYINNEIEKAKRGEEAMIRIKVNNLEEPNIISLLYKASQAGVKVNLIIRSVCCLVPGLPGISENITVKRLVDRYLEHTRLMIFGAGENAEVLMGSADLMTRNLYHRIEVCVSIKTPFCKKELLDYFEIQWNDNDSAVVLTSNLEQKKPDTHGEKINAQHAIYHYLKNKV